MRSYVAVLCVLKLLNLMRCWYIGQNSELLVDLWTPPVQNTATGREVEQHGAPFVSFASGCSDSLPSLVSMLRASSDGGRICRDRSDAADTDTMMDMLAPWPVLGDGADRLVMSFEQLEVSTLIDNQRIVIKDVTITEL